MKKNLLITGATSGIGLQIVKFLYNQNYNIYAVGRDFISLNKFDNINKVEIDLLNLKEVKKVFFDLSKKVDFDLLINCAGIGKFCQHEDIKIEEIENITTLNLTIPMILSKLLLKSLKSKNGTIINISSIESVRSSKFSALYSATKSGLRAFSLALFEEVRKDGVKVIVINPDMTDTNFFDNLTFGISDDKMTYLTVFNIEKLIENILNFDTNCCITELTIRPQKVGIKKKKIVKH
jgi:short-subunit dehydrogenase